MNFGKARRVDLNCHEIDTSQDDAQAISSTERSDAIDMRRMGLPLKLRRRFTSVTVFGFACVLGATWEYALVTTLSGLTNGGSGGTIWLFLAVMVGMFSVILSLAEMASMAPTSAGQYHWVGEFAPARYRRVAGYAVGWFTAIGWQASTAGNALIVAQQVQALVAFTHPSWSAPSGFDWLTMVLMLGTMTIATGVNMYGMRLLPWLEGAMFILHIAEFLAILLPLWIMGDKIPAEKVFFTFEDNAGWGSVGLSCLVGILGPTVTLVGGDSAVHLAEETRKASRSLPIAMISTAVVNYIIGFVMTVTILTVSGSFDTDLADQIGQSYIAVIYAATRSRAATIVLTVVLICLFFFCTVNCTLTSSRQLWALARDRGLPYSAWLSKINRESGLPTNSLITTCGVTVLLSFIAAGSAIAFNNIISISLVGLLLSYGCTILTMMIRRTSSVPLPQSYLRFSTSVGSAINGIALCFVLLAFVFVFVPTAPAPTPASMNWSVLISGCVILFAGIYYLLHGHENYIGPAERIDGALRGDTSGTGPTSSEVGCKPFE